MVKAEPVIYLCVACGYLYESKQHMTELDDKWYCPDCGRNKSCFEPVEINIDKESKASNPGQLPDSDI